MLYDYDANTEDELSASTGQVLELYDDKDADWWLVRDTASNRSGLIPGNYVEREQVKKEAAKKPPPMVGRSPAAMAAASAPVVTPSPAAKSAAQPAAPTAAQPQPQPQQPRAGPSRVPGAVSRGRWAPVV